MSILPKLIVGDIAWIDEREHKFEGMVRLTAGRTDPPDAIKFVDVLNNDSRVSTLEEFEEIYASCRVVFPKSYERPGDAPPDENAPDFLQRRVRQRYLEAYDAAPASKSDRALRAFIVATAPTIGVVHAVPSSGTLRRWITQRGDVGDRRMRFMGDRVRRGARPMLIHDLAKEVLAEVAQKFWGNIRVTPAQVYHETRDTLAKTNKERVSKGLPPIAPPSKATVWRYVTSHCDYDNSRLRLGDRIASDRFKAIKGSMKVSRILEIAIVDHTVLDCMVVDEETLMNVGRPYLTVIIDAYSRYPLAFYLSFEPPSVFSTMACLRRAVRPKTEIKALYPDIEGKWEAYGVPNTIVADNAWEFVGSSFVDACADAGISVEWSPVASPRYKGIGERFFGTLNSMLIHRLTGSVPFTPQARKELGIDPEAEAAMPISAVQQLICQAIIEVYGNETHRTLNAAPARVWREQAAKYGVQLAADLPALDRGLSKLGQEKTLAKEGLKHDGLVYRSPEVSELLNRLVPLEKKRGVKAGTVRVKYKYHPEDLSEIYVWNSSTNGYVTIPCTQPEYARGLSEHHHKTLKKYAKDNNLKFRTEDERCAARVRLQQAIRKLLPIDKVRTKSRAQRLKSQEPVLQTGDTVKRTVVDDANVEYEIPNSTLNNRQSTAKPERAPRKASKSRRQNPREAVEPARWARAAEPSPQPSAPTTSANPLAGFNTTALLAQARKALGGAR